FNNATVSLILLAASTLAVPVPSDLNLQQEDAEIKNKDGSQAKLHEQEAAHGSSDAGHANLHLKQDSYKEQHDKKKEGNNQVKTNHVNENGKSDEKNAKHNSNEVNAKEIILKLIKRKIKMLKRM
ncbi:hypothetical protein C2G38_2121556, partial [Gigaspora rosea]